MKELKIAIAGVLAAGTLLSGPVLAELGTSTENGATSENPTINENDEVTLGFNHPQSLSVSSPNNVTERSSNGIINRTWHVVSNNAVTIKMSGKSPNETDGENAYPVFYKQEVDASGAVIANKYDHLVTTYGATIEGFYDTTTTNAGSAKVDWAGGAAVAKAKANGSDPDTVQTNGQNPTADYASVLTGKPKDLVGVGGVTPNASFGTIMPSDDGRFKMTLSAKGIGDVATTQSGDYQVTVVASFMANEQGTKTVSAAAAETGFLSTTQVHGNLGADQRHNTKWNLASSTSTGALNADGTYAAGKEQSAQVISDAAGDTKASNLDRYTE